MICYHPIVHWQAVSYGIRDIHGKLEGVGVFG